MTFLNQHDNTRDEPRTLLAAVDEGNIEEVKQFIRNGADVRELNYIGAPPLQYAAARGHLEIARILVQHGADVNYRIAEGGTPLMGAAACLKPHMIEFLLSKGAQPNKKGVNGRFPLVCPYQPAVAAIEKQIECIRLLVRAGGRINEQTDSGGTALMNAAWFRNVEAVEELLRNGADPEIRDHNGKTAAILAFERGYDELANLLKNAKKPKK